MGAVSFTIATVLVCFVLPDRTPQTRRFLMDSDLSPRSGGWEGQGGGASAEGLGAASGLGGRRHMLRESRRGLSLVLKRVHSCDDVNPFVVAEPCDLIAPLRPHLSTQLHWRFSNTGTLGTHQS